MYDVLAVREDRLAVVVPDATLWQVVSPVGAVRSYHHAPVCLAMVNVAVVVVRPEAVSLGCIVAVKLILIAPLVLNSDQLFGSSRAASAMLQPVPVGVSVCASLVV